jgi:competence protein ComEC
VRLLALATSGLILADPFLVHSVGFRLSCGATAGIALLAGPLAGRLPGPEFARRSLAVTTAAQIGVAPVALPLFGGLPLVALPANLAAAPAAAALTVWGLGSGLAGGLVAGWWPGVAELLQVPTGVLAGSIAGVAALAARIPVAVTPGPVTVAAVVAAAYAVRCGRWSGWWRRPAHRPAVPTAAAGRGRTAPGR